MEFEVTGFFFVDPYYLDEMYRLCKEQGLSPKDAAQDVALGWDDCDYYIYEYIEDQIIAEIEKRLAEKG